jgi:outer membrane lipoprotein-sorting protein
MDKNEMFWWIGNAQTSPIMRRFAILAALSLALLGQPAHAARYPGTYSDAEAAQLDKLSAYLNAIHTLKSNFVQLGPEGDLAQGEFDLAKPGRLRFSYNPPSPILIVATDGEIYVKNSQLNTVDHTALSDTPLDLLLNQAIDLRHNSAVTSVEEQPGALIVHARASALRKQSNITLVFSYPAIELRQWMVKDN